MEYIRYLLALILVLGLVWLFGFALKKYGMRFGQNWSNRWGKRAVADEDDKPALAIQQILGIDARRRVVLLEVKGEDVLLLLGPNGDTILRITKREHGGEHGAEHGEDMMQTNQQNSLENHKHFQHYLHNHDGNG